LSDEPGWRRAGGDVDLAAGRRPGLREPTTSEDVARGGVEHDGAGPVEVPVGQRGGVLGDQRLIFL
jgi:hypothetical protein